MEKSSDLVAEALVREYLAKHGLDSTLKAFEKERPRGDQSITNRSTLRKMTGVEKLAAKLKKKHPDDPSPSTLEMLASHQLSKQAAAGATASAAAVEEKEESNAPPPKPRQGFGFDSASSISSGHDRQDSQPPRRPPSSDFASMSVNDPPEMANKLRSKESDDMMMMEDVDDFDADFGSGGGGSTWMPPSKSSSRGNVSIAGSTPLSPDDARKVQDKLFGALGCPDSWKQGFFFGKTHKLEYGLVQTQGGPCGILAAVQARVLVALADEKGSPQITNLNKSKLENALVQGIATTLWKCGKEHQAVVVSCGEAGTSHLPLQQMLRSCKYSRPRSLDATEDAVRASLAQLQQPDGWGIVLFLFSLMMSAGIESVNSNMDDPSGNMMGAHGYCTQDLVNLIICGSAVTNVFDKVKKLDELTILRGVPQKGPIGFLSLFDWYKYIEVGSFYREPECGVWVICCESHFTCLFCTDYPTVSRNQVPFDLYYYDGLANQTEEIRFSITKSPTGGHTARAGGDSIGSRGAMEGDLTPPMEFVIETRWPGVNVDWNGVDPIL